MQGQKSGAGALMGAIAGGAIGNNVGGGDGRTAATLLGLVGGAMVGNNIEGEAAPVTKNVQRCLTEQVIEPVWSDSASSTNMQGFSIGLRWQGTRALNLPFV